MTIQDGAVRGNTARGGNLQGGKGGGICGNDDTVASSSSPGIASARGRSCWRW